MKIDLCFGKDIFKTSYAVLKSFTESGIDLDSAWDNSCKLFLGVLKDSFSCFFFFFFFFFFFWGGGGLNDNGCFPAFSLKFPLNCSFFMEVSSILCWQTALKFLVHNSRMRILTARWEQTAHA